MTSTASATSKPPTKKRERYPPLTSRQKDLIRFFVLERFLNGVAPAAIAAATASERGIKISREAVYQLVRESVRDNYLLYAPPMDRLLTQQLQSLPNSTRADDPNAKNEIRVVHAYGKRASQVVSHAAGDITFKLIRELAHQRGRCGEVHIAFGIGRTTMHLVEYLAARLRSWGKAPPLVVHAITPTFSMRNPLDTPVAAFTLLSKAVKDLEFVNLEMQPFVPAADYERMLQQSPIKKALQRALEVDIVITSFADSQDEHGYLRGYLEREEPAGLRDLDAAGWLGDVHLCPFTATRPHVIESGVRPVTLFQLPQLVQMANSKERHVVLLSAPCNYCGVHKGRALRPLLTQPDLRVWNHLVVDYQTAEWIADS